MALGGIEVLLAEAGVAADRGGADPRAVDLRDVSEEFLLALAVGLLAFEGLVVLHHHHVVVVELLEGLQGLALADHLVELGIESGDVGHGRGLSCVSRVREPGNPSVRGCSGRLATLVVGFSDALLESTLL